MRRGGNSGLEAFGSSCTSFGIVCHERRFFGSAVRALQCEPEQPFAGELPPLFDLCQHDVRPIQFFFVPLSIDQAQSELGYVAKFKYILQSFKQFAISVRPEFWQQLILDEADPQYNELVIKFSKMLKQKASRHADPHFYIHSMVAQAKEVICGFIPNANYSHLHSAGLANYAYSK